MNENLPNTNTSISELLSRWPEVIPIFTRHHMGCVGCTMSAYETVASAAEIYRLPVDDFLREILQTLPE
jgi:hybrid cluster-associated redox disulfide protein